VSYLVAIVSLDDDFHAESFIPSGARVSVPGRMLFALMFQRKDRKGSS
jgi:hypothetical protein